MHDPDVYEANDRQVTRVTGNYHPREAETRLKWASLEMGRGLWLPLFAYIRLGLAR